MAIEAVGAVGSKKAEATSETLAYIKNPLEKKPEQDSSAFTASLFGFGFEQNSQGLA